MSRSRRRRQASRRDPPVKRAPASEPRGSMQFVSGGALHRYRIGAICIFLAILTLVVYRPVWQHPFINYDDGAYILFNPHVQQGLTSQTLTWALTTFYEANWHPLTWVVHALNCQLFGLDAGGHHMTSLLLHVLNAVLLFLLLMQATGAMWRSMLAATLFAVHPLNVESVAWAAELKNLLCTFFFLLALGTYGWYARKPAISRYVVLALLFVLGLASKPMVIALPFVLLLLDFWPLRRIVGWTQPSQDFPVAQRSFSSLLLEKAPLVALSIASAVVTLFGQRSVGADNMVRVSLIGRFENALQSYAMYLGKALWPTDLAPFYPYSPVSSPIWPVIAGLFLLFVSAWVWKARHKSPYLITGWLWYLGTLVPVIGLVQVGGQARADRYAYIPLIGVFVMTVWRLADFADLKMLRLSARLVPAIASLAVFSLLAWHQDSYWNSRYDLWTHTLEVTKNNPVAEHNLAMDLMRSQRWDEAVPHLAKANELNPADTVSLVDLGTVLSSQGRHQDAVKEYEKVLQRSAAPSILLPAYHNLGNEYRILGNYEKSEANYRQALRISPDDVGVLKGLDKTIRERRISELSKALSRRPTANGFLEYGRALREAKRDAEARQAYQKALKLDPKLREARDAVETLSGSGGNG
jgi:protein O-mannosyl-transferase